jgi:hypothetical protein
MANDVRPQSSIRERTPNEFAEKGRSESVECKHMTGQEAEVFWPTRIWKLSNCSVRDKGGKLRTDLAT